jgi:hypothetical protein
MLRTERATELQVYAIRGEFQRVLAEYRPTCHGKLYTTESFDIIFMVALCQPYITFTRLFWTAESPGTNTCVRPACSDVRPSVCLRSAWLLHQNTRCLCKPVFLCNKGVLYLLSGSDLIGRNYLQPGGWPSEFRDLYSRPVMWICSQSGTFCGWLLCCVVTLYYIYRLFTARQTRVRRWTGRAAENYEVLLSVLLLFRLILQPGKFSMPAGRTKLVLTCVKLCLLVLTCVDLSHETYNTNLTVQCRMVIICTSTMNWT